MTRSLVGKVAIVTGAGQNKGIGRAAALKLAEQGASVVVTDVCQKRDDLVIEGTLRAPVARAWRWRWM